MKVMADGTLKVLDFGLIRDKEIYSPTPAKRLENEHYLSPEQLKGGPPDRGANLFTAAGIFYEMFTTRHPFGGKHLGEVDKNINDVEPHALNLAHPRVPEAISKVILKALSKRRLDRFQSGRELAAALEEAFNPSSAKASAPPPPRPAAAAPPSPVAPVAAKPPVPPAPVAPVMAASAGLPVAAAAAPPVTAETATRMSAPPAPTSPAPAMSAAVVDRNKPGAGAPSASTTGVSKAGVSDARNKLPPSRTPAKQVLQWKMAAGIVGGLVVIAALGMALGHRTKVPPPPVAAQEPTPLQLQQPATAEASPQADPEPTPWLSVEEPQPAAKAKRGKTKAEPVAPAPAAPASVANGQLAISSTPPGATVEIAERPGESWKTPQTVAALAPGSYKVTWSKAGFATETRTIQIASGSRANLDVNLTATKGYLAVTATPAGAHILIDGKDTGKVSPADFMLDPVVHNVAVRQEGYLDSATDLKLAAGQTSNYAPVMKAAGRTDNIKVVSGGLKKVFGGNSSQGMTVVQIKTDPKGAQIVINGSPFSKTTPVDIQLEPGNYEISLQKDGYKPVHKSISAEPNGKIRIDEQLAAQ